MTDKKNLGANEGEGSRSAARDYDQAAEKFVKDGKVAPAAEQARAAVDRDPAGAAADEAAARTGPKEPRPHLDDIVKREESVVDKVKHAVGKLRPRH